MVNINNSINPYLINDCYDDNPNTSNISDIKIYKINRDALPYINEYNIENIDDNNFHDIQSNINLNQTYYKWK